MLLPNFSATLIDMESKYLQEHTFLEIEAQCRDYYVCRRVFSWTFSFFLKKNGLEGKQFLLFSDPCSEVGSHSGFPIAS